MAIQAWVKGFCKAAGQWLGMAVTPEGSVSTASHGSAMENYFSASGTVTTGTPVNYNLLKELGRRANSGYLAVDGAADVSVYIDGDHNDPITVMAGEVLCLDGANAAVIILTTAGTGIAYRLLVK